MKGPQYSAVWWLLIASSRPLGEVLSRLVRPNRQGPPQPGPKLRPRGQDRHALRQDQVQDFYPVSEKKVGKHKPGPPRPRKRRPEKKRPPVGFGLSNPFKDLLDRSPLKHKNRFPSKAKGGSFRPPSKVFNGFSPSFKGSLSLEEARRQYEEEQYDHPHHLPASSMDTEMGGHKPSKHPAKHSHDKPRKKR